METFNYFFIVLKSHLKRERKILPESRFNLNVQTNLCFLLFPPTGRKYCTNSRSTSDFLSRLQASTGLNIRSKTLKSAVFKSKLILLPIMFSRAKQKIENLLRNVCCIPLHKSSSSTARSVRKSCRILFNVFLVHCILFMHV